MNCPFLLDFFQRKDIRTPERDKSAGLPEELTVRCSPILCPNVFEVRAGNEYGLLTFFQIMKMGKVQPTNLGKYFKPYE